MAGYFEIAFGGSAGGGSVNIYAIRHKKTCLYLICSDRFRKITDPYNATLFSTPLRPDLLNSLYGPGYEFVEVPKERQLTLLEVA